MRAPLGIGLAELDATIGPIAAGADGVTVLPFFNGERVPNLPRAKACVLGLDAGNTTAAHLLRATVEGATFALRYGIDELEALGMNAGEIVLTGGGANSRVWQQIVADVTGLPVTLLKNNEGACFGAALQALWTLERRANTALTIGSITDAHVVRDPDRGAAPDKDATQAYELSYAAYRRAVAHISPLYSH
jgi:xylulokinase